MTAMTAARRSPRLVSFLAAAVSALGACRAEPPASQAAAQRSATPPAAGSATAGAAGSAGSAGSAAGSAAGAPADPATAPDDPTANANQYVPAEFKAGAARWKDTGVYLDGQPVGFLSFGDLPISLKPVFVKEQVSANKRPNSNDPGFRWTQTRFYRFTDYFKALGIDLRKIKEVHVYGPKFGDSIIASGQDLRSPKAAEFMFRFGGDINGKALPHVPMAFGNRMSPDKISAVMIYVTKTPPTLAEDGFVLDGKPVDGVPYYGEPVRGGVRVYLDDRLATIIKRAELDPKAATPGPDGELRWPLAAFLDGKGVDRSHLVEAYVIRDDRREEKLTAAEVASLYFVGNSQAKGGVLLGDKKVLANALALHTRALSPDELPKILPDEEW